MLVAVAFAVLAFRPLWLVSRRDTAPQYVHYVRFLQKAEHLPLDGYRDYAELSVNWVTWYTGWLAFAFGVAGIAYLVVRAMRGGAQPELLFVLLFAFTAALYLVKPSIAPDQLWAVRRLLPVVIPGLYAGCSLVLALLAARRQRWGRLVAVAVRLP